MLPLSLIIAQYFLSLLVIPPRYDRFWHVGSIFAARGLPLEPLRTESSRFRRPLIPRRLAIAVGFGGGGFFLFGGFLSGGGGALLMR